MPQQPQTLQELRIYKCANLLSITSEALGALSPQTLVTLIIERTSIDKLPTNVGDLISLKELRLSANRLTSLPADLGRLTQLQKLNVSDNILHFIPSSVSQLTSLRSLNVSNNRLLYLPPELHQLSLLKELVATGNPLVSPPAYVCSRSAPDVRSWLFLHMQALRGMSGSPVPFLRHEPFDTNAEKKDGGVPVDVTTGWFTQLGAKLELLLEVGICETNGKRPYMEDRFTVTTLKLQDADNRPAQFYAVYDGHEGELAADYCRMQMHKTIARQPEFSALLASMS